MMCHGMCAQEGRELHVVLRRYESLGVGFEKAGRSLWLLDLAGSGHSSL